MYYLILSIVGLLYTYIFAHCALNGFYADQRSIKNSESLLLAVFRFLKTTHPYDPDAQSKNQ